MESVAYEFIYYFGCERVHGGICSCTTKCICDIHSIVNYWYIPFKEKERGPMKVIKLPIFKTAHSKVFDLLKQGYRIRYDGMMFEVFKGGKKNGKRNKKKKNGETRSIRVNWF